MKVDYTLTPEEQVNMMQLMIAELSAYWKSRAVKLERPIPIVCSPDPLAFYAALELGNCARHLDRILEGKPTEADGFRMEVMEHDQERRLNLKKLTTLEKYNTDMLQAYENTHQAQKPHPNGIECPRCGKELWDSNPMITLTSEPAQKNVHCQKCGYTGYRFA